jgi:hypothetical protein
MHYAAVEDEPSILHGGLRECEGSQVGTGSYYLLQYPAITVRRRYLITLFGVLAIVAVPAGLKVHYRGKAPVSLSPSSCDAGLWEHVYERQRLQVLTECTAVEGRVAYIRRSEDGDLHVALEPDDKSVLNLINLVHAHGTLVVEAACEHSPVGVSEQQACANYQSQVTVPKPGERVRVTGAYVTDTDNDWREVHPVSRIEILP